MEKKLKTNQMMEVKLGDFTLAIEHKTQLGNLTSLWDYGNGLRVAKGKKALDLFEYLRSAETCEYLIEIERFFNSGISPYLELETTTQGRAKIVGGKLTCLKTKRGRYGGTWANLFVLLDAATKLDAAFKVRVYDTFINKEILQWRDKSGDSFKELNVAMDKHLSDSKGTGNNKLFYIEMAMLIHGKILKSCDWNNATSEQLTARTKTLTQAVSILELGLVKNFNHLKKLILQMR